MQSLTVWTNYYSEDHIASINLPPQVRCYCSTTVDLQAGSTSRAIGTWHSHLPLARSQWTQTDVSSVSRAARPNRSSTYFCFTSLAIRSCVLRRCSKARSTRIGLNSKSAGYCSARARIAEIMLSDTWWRALRSTSSYLQTYSLKMSIPEYQKTRFRLGSACASPKLIDLPARVLRLTGLEL